MRLASLLTFAVLVLYGCATPVPPSGGPRDETPPSIVSAEPEPGSVNVEGQSVRIEFSEWVDQSSFQRALSVAPEPDGGLSFSWRRRSVRIDFPEPFRPNTTYVLTIDTEFRDSRGVRLSSPVTLAFSTGPTINQGQIAGRLVEPRHGAPVGGIDIYAYAGPSSDAPPLASLPERPHYRTQTGDEGSFSFEYLSEEPYFVIALRDANRNRRPDPGEAFAVPPEPWIEADTSGSPVDEPWILALSDTLAPSLSRVRALTNRRIELRYSEPVILVSRDPDEWHVTDSIAGVQRDVLQVYAQRSLPNNVYVLTEAMSPGPHILRTGTVADSSGNSVGGIETSFEATAVEDTVTSRFVGFVPDTTEALGDIVELLTWQRPGVEFTTPPTDEELRSRVSLSDTANVRTIAEFRTTDGTTFALATDPPLQPGDSVAVEVQAPGTRARQVFRRLNVAETGEISGVVGADTTGPIVVEVYEDDEDVPLRSVVAAPDGTFVMAELPEGAYQLRLFQDLNRDGVWTGGSIIPYVRPEPVSWWNEEVNVRPRWETALPDTVRLQPIGPGATIQE